MLDWITLNSQLERLVNCFQPPPNAHSVGFNLPEAARTAYICCILLRAFTSSDQLNNHLDALEGINYRKDIRNRLQTTIFKSKAATAFCYALYYGEIVKWLGIPTENAEGGGGATLVGSTMLVRRTPVECFVNSGIMSACSALVSFHARFVSPIVSYLF